MTSTPLIVDFDALCDVLRVQPNSFRRIWSTLPHFQVGVGKDRRGARFDVAEVLTYLKTKKGVNYGRLQGCDG